MPWSWVSSSSWSRDLSPRSAAKDGTVDTVGDRPQGGPSERGPRPREADRWPLPTTTMTTTTTATPAQAGVTRR